MKLITQMLRGGGTCWSVPQEVSLLSEASVSSALSIIASVQSCIPAIVLGLCLQLYMHYFIEASEESDIKLRYVELLLVPGA